MDLDLTPEQEEFRRQQRELYIASGSAGFWQGAIRDPADPSYEALISAEREGTRLILDLLYGDHEGGQRTITRFAMQPRSDEGYLVVVARHWNIDRADPR